VSRPQVLVLDEPTVGQDPVVRRDLWHRFHALAEAGTTLLVSSHVLDEAGRCDRLLLIRNGRLVADDTPDAVRRKAGTSDLETAFLRMVLAGEARGPQTSEAV
jgi:ABC-2 type transport system ATP-binding protein